MPSVKDFMTKDIITIDIQKTVLAAAMLMSEKMIGCLVVADGKMPVGIVTERDFVRRVVARNLSPDMELSQIMSKPLITIDPDSSLRDAARLMLKNKIRRLPVIKENRLVGIVVASDFARRLSKKTISEEILDVLARYPPSIPHKWGARRI